MPLLAADASSETEHTIILAIVSFTIATPIIAVSIAPSQPIAGARGSPPRAARPHHAPAFANTYRHKG